MAAAGMAATMPPPLDALPEAANKAWGRHPGGLASTTGLATKLNPPPMAAGETNIGGFDPTFVGLGWGHKRQLRPPPPQYVKDRPGRRCKEQPHSFASCDFLKQDLAAHGPQAVCSLKATRFGKGFARRRADGMGDRQRMVREEERASQLEEGRAVRREKLTSLQSKNGCNPLTGGPPIAGLEVPYKPTKPKMKPRLLIEKEQATEMTHRQDLKHTVTSTFGPEVDLGRRPLLPPRPEWSVGHQLASYDGFVCPKAVKDEMGLRLPRPGRRIYAARHAAGELSGGLGWLEQPKAQQPSPPVAVDG